MRVGWTSVKLHLIRRDSIARTLGVINLYEYGTSEPTREISARFLVSSGR